MNLGNAQMKQKALSPVEALQGAVEMLQAISKGRSYPAMYFMDRLIDYEKTLDKLVLAEADRNRKHSR